jgi:hypothetical protein
LRSPDAGADESFLPWWRVLLYLVLGVGFAVRHNSGWLQVVGWAAAALATADLIGHLRWRHRRRLR